ncbi:hypothetical protein JCM11491_001630 [Sporobolomyces phaffii]
MKSFHEREASDDEGGVRARRSEAKFGRGLNSLSDPYAPRPDLPPPLSPFSVSPPRVRRDRGMFWRQIPRATDVLSSRPPAGVAPATEDAQRQVPYSSRDGSGGGRGGGGGSAEFDGRDQWKKAIERVWDDGHRRRHDERPLRTVHDVVREAVAHDREKRNTLKGIAGRLRRRSSAARLRRPPRLDLEGDDSPDPITLAKITPFDSSPPASLCGGPREDPGPAATAESLSSLDQVQPHRPSTSSIESDLIPQARPHLTSPNPYPPSPARSDDGDDDESTLPPYEALESSRLLTARPPPLSHSSTAPSLTAAAPTGSASRPALNRRVTVAAGPASCAPLPPLPPPPAPFPSRRLSAHATPAQRNDYDAPSSGLRVQEGRPSSRTISRRSSIASLRTRPERPAYHRLYGMSGLTNLGNSCYMSAVIQGLAATDLLSRFLSSGEYRQEVNHENRNGSQGRIAEALSVLFGAMTGGQHRVITPGRFRDIISSASQFDNYDQQDAHDFLLYLLDALHEDLNLVLDPGPPLESSAHLAHAYGQMSEVEAADREWATYRDNNDSIVIDYFQGQLRNRMECLYCHETSTTYNPLQTLPLPIPDQRSDVFINLEDCIDEFLREEILDDENAWNCPRCRRARTASKQLAITRLPQILIVQLKRFTSHASFASKVETLVDFPLDGLDLGDLLPEGSTSDEYRLNLPHEVSTNYELYAVVNHLGEENTSGHYTATVRKGATFLEIDDETISAVPPSDMVERYGSSAYLLFYRLTGQADLQHGLN